MDFNKIIERIRQHTDEYVNIGVEVNRGQSTSYNPNPVNDISWKLYISGIGNESFDTFDELKAYVTIVCDKMAGKRDVASEIREAWKLAKELQKEESNV